MDVSKPSNKSNSEGVSQIQKINDPDKSMVIEEYMKSLTTKQYKAYEIARDHLKDSFQIEKSNGFLAWVKKNHSSMSFC
jgi:hypothetical protein